MYLSDMVYDVTLGLGGSHPGMCVAFINPDREVSPL